MSVLHLISKSDDACVKGCMDLGIQPMTSMYARLCNVRAYPLETFINHAKV
jgi:hypothetical protein